MSWPTHAYMHSTQTTRTNPISRTSIDTSMESLRPQVVVVVPALSPQHAIQNISIVHGVNSAGELACAMCFMWRPAESPWRCAQSDNAPDGVVSDRFVSAFFRRVHDIYFPIHLSHTYLAVCERLRVTTRGLRLSSSPHRI
jgi:hypothetical protein